MKRGTPILLVIPLLALFGSGPAHGGWLPEGNPIRTAADAVVPGEVSRAIVPDGAGGAYLVWSTGAGGGEVRAQRVDADGQPLWTPGGILIDGAGRAVGSAAGLAQCAPDGNGGLLVSWVSNRTAGLGAEFDVFAQRLDPSGARLWTDPPAPLNGDPTDVFFASAGPEIVGDGQGGAILGWSEMDPVTEATAVKLQRIAPNGTVLGPAGGVVPTQTAALPTTEIQLAADIESGFVFATWSVDYGSDYDAAVGRYALGSAITSPLTVRYISAVPSDETGAQPLPDGRGGVYVTYRTNEFTYSASYTLAYDGAMVQRWPDRVRASSLSEGQLGVVTAVDPETGNLFVHWGDFRNSGTGQDLFVQCLRYEDGAPQWLSNGVPLAQVAGTQSGGQIAPRPGGGAVVVWHDGRDSVPTDQIDMYVQAVDAQGRTLWTPNGVRLIERAGNQFPWQPAYVTPEDLFVPFRDTYPGTSFTQLRLQRVDLRHGYWGRPEPVLNAVVDVDPDQGGVVEATWSPSDHDIIGLDTITHYSVWRATTALARGTAPGPVVDRRSIPRGFEGEAYALVGDYYWEYVGQQIASALPGYAYSVPTTANGVDVAVQVIAHTAQPTVAFPSAEAVGKSFDNLAPAAPLALNGSRSGATSIDLGWRPSGEEEADFATFRVLRSDGSAFDPGTATLVGATPDTNLVDVDVVGGQTYTYAVVATDVNGNVSETSNLVTIVDTATGIDDGVSVTTLMMRPNAPNPFSHATQLRFALPKAGPVELDVFDLAGRRVRTERRELAAGWHVMPFEARDDGGRDLASGVYMVRIRAGEQTVNGRITVMR